MSVSYGNKTKELISFLETTTIHHLTLVHRCTGNVFKEFQMFSGPLTRIGHQHEGRPTETKVVERQAGEDLVTAWSRTIKTCYDEQV